MNRKNLVLTICLAAIIVFGGFVMAHEGSHDEDSAVRATVKQFEDGLNARDLKKIEAVVAEDMVAFENGHRNANWADFRDHHLLPEMKEPAPPSKTEMIKVKVAGTMAWAYSRTDMELTRKSGEKAKAELWSIYILEKRDKSWKIVVLDWSMRIERPKAS